MKIRKIKYYNFRNFGEQGEVSFDTDGKMTIIYGTNGDGKTTFHQLFQWILYGETKFNKTTSKEKLYNLEKGKQANVGRMLTVWGEIEFEHAGDEYSVRRQWAYNKNSNNDIVRSTRYDEFVVQKKMENYDWRELDRPKSVIETVIPQGLAPYFFFDGETMIADLKIRGTDSAKELKKALYSIFDLEVYEKAKTDIGAKNKLSSVIGQLEQKRIAAQAKSTTEERKKAYFKDIKILKSKLEVIDSENEEYQEQVKQNSRKLQEISEAIGTNASKKQLENNRKNMQKNVEKFEKDIQSELRGFGKEIEDKYAYLLIAKTVKDADKRLYMQVQSEEKKIIPGLTKELLLSFLTTQNHPRCICGREIGNEELQELEVWKSYFPPASYKATYDKYQRNAVRYERKYEQDRLFTYMKKIIGLKGDVRENENAITELDNQLKLSMDIDNLIDERKKIEKEIEDKRKAIDSNNSLRGEWEHQLKIRERSVANIGKASSEVRGYEVKIELMEAVEQRIKEMLINETSEYSNMLKVEIQKLIDKMLTSEREVILNADFQFQVKDSYGDESKSEGQFAVISFAYIGGILKVLQSHDKLMNKEYPLILDGPFSKLDPEQKQNVIDAIPKYAPQVVIFSKDPLEEYIPAEKIGKVWTIQSNSEKNNASVKAGNLWK